MSGVRDNPGFADLTGNACFGSTGNNFCSA
jgi:hypothetical protein